MYQYPVISKGSKPNFADYHFEKYLRRISNSQIYFHGLRINAKSGPLENYQLYSMYVQYVPIQVPFLGVDPLPFRYINLKSKRVDLKFFPH